ncbi:L-xylulose reductase-like [Ruditapes philippinarum]|uniref:L-xylulose reductase-like n=1 Tax=Ruditapes philippinarum TaxID=129788 RepID=UPI00295B44DD|nr:L-xylulose reductase-like [Ruditapes philippinarum]
MEQADGMAQTDFKGKRALVTGAGKGIGRAIAIRLANLGAKVFGISRTQSDLDSLKKEVPSIETRLLDISEWDKTREVVENLGPIDLLVNNAGIIKHTPFLEITKEEFDDHHNINFRAAFNISQVVARGMAERGNGGAIVNISSIAAIRTTAYHTSYSPSKAALDMMTSSMAHELGCIRVNSVNPTVVMTELGKKVWGDPVKQAAVLSRIPIGRCAEEEDIVNATVFLLSEKSSMITGVTLPVDGGMLIDIM